MSAVSFTQFVREQWLHLPLAVSTETCSGGTYIVTGANTGLGLEAARHLAGVGAKKVVLGVRNMKSGEEAKVDIEKTSKTRGIVEVWPLDLSSCASVKAFSKRAIQELDRIDAVIENAGVAYNAYKSIEGHEESVVINVLNTFLLAVLLFPKLEDAAKKFNILPHLVIISSETAFMANARTELSKVQSDPLRKMDDEKLADMSARYPFTKLIQVLAARQLASLLPVEQRRVVINYVNPGLCKTGLSRHVGIVQRLQINMAKNLLGRTAEQGSRNLLYGAVAAKESHGCYVGNCEIEDDRVPDWITDAKGRKTQQRVWDDIAQELEKIEPGCIQRLEGSH
ncbi:hypothetical protein PFICI_12150 [Pestalotiopsis fici W106-1]|uniref:Uncharacterized protein n=1 Tax=Pestalotiopsis fici (strain W106-1 / CGMCC3.15140) TaxID=1229662 RepID=W3WSD2_PESFW|nr:uncharacterized protein PFICI_12150 [Pestalotiopsis fici W106-1]ETS76763.1 hypothetical protein PFICI_12150 [Pestalotiopsis fici W106-1]